MSFSQDELSVNAKGGTELMKAGLTKHVDPDLLDKVHITFSRVRDLATDKPNIFYAHDLPGDPEAQFLRDPTLRQRFDKIVFVSDWQMQMYNTYLGVPYAESIVIPNAIEPMFPLIPYHKFPSEKMVKSHFNQPELRIIYHTTPHRGLDILVPVFESLVKRYEGTVKLVLDVYSSFKIYGWEERDQPYQALFERCKNHPNINYHGTVSNEEVRKAVGKAHIFAYPSIWPETSCIAGIEALAGGCIMVCPNLAALPETTAKYANMYQFHEDINVHAHRFAERMINTIDSFIYEYDEVRDHVDRQVDYFGRNYEWEFRAPLWNAVLRDVIDGYDKRKGYLTFDTGGAKKG
jgi:UDP-glucose:(glucosyl)LPS alpha-1,2-glucosyltransferase